MTVFEDDDSSASGSAHYEEKDEHGSPSTHGSSSVSGNGGETDNAPEKGAALARQETRAVRRLRCFLLLILVVALVASVTVYVIVSKEEDEDFKTAFTSQGQKVIQGFQDDSMRKLQAMDSLSRSFTAHAINSNSTWPYVTVPNSAAHFESYLSLTNAAALTILPIVGRRQRVEWEEYSVDNKQWLDQDLEFMERQKQHHEENAPTLRALQTNAETILEQEQDLEMSPYIKNYVGLDTSGGPWVVFWQYFPVIHNRYFVNFNSMAVEDFEQATQAVVQDKAATLSRTWTFEADLDLQSTRDFSFTQELLAAGGYANYEGAEPIGYIYYPVLNQLDASQPQETVALLSATVYWKTYFLDLLPQGVNGIHAVVENSHGQVFTYEIRGQDAVYLGTGDFHDNGFDGYVMDAGYADFLVNVDAQDNDNNKYTGVPVGDEYLSYRIRVYPTSEFRDDYMTNRPLMYSGLMVAGFLAIAAIFLLYDRIVEKRQKIVLSTAVKSNAIVSSLFPENVRDRLMDEAMKDQGKGRDNGSVMLNPDMFAVDGAADPKSSKPIADFFPECTVIFADIVGFTAWSSTREPAQVFQLLETVYNAFDVIATKRKIFKVETIGDCYVAAAGIPVPRDDHAVAACRFAELALRKMESLTREMELELGPGTGDLSMRFGLHSGAVTAGVLRGAKSRFQLFGDTMNTAARIESTGKKGRVHLSEDVAKLLIDANKGHWIVKREDTVYAKGKGEMTTYFLKMRGSGDSNSDSLPSESQDGSNADTSTDREISKNDARLIDWNTGVMRHLLQQIVARRRARGQDKAEFTDVPSTPKNCNVVDEVKEIITLPEFDNSAGSVSGNLRDVDLGESVESQLHLFVSSVCRMYRANPFHNFEHASHVTMSVSKLLSRIVAPSDVDYKRASLSGNIASTLHDHTYGITSDPLTQLACVFSALIHDADHPGVPNAQLVKENAPLAQAYSNKCIAEQNSVDLCWDLLTDDTFQDLRACICGSEAEYVRFRQLVVNSVMATDIMDKDLKALRNARWDTAFAPKEGAIDKDNVNRKATIVIEHIIQASDVAHTMQHWHIYRKWNAKLFEEMYRAYKDGRAAKNPAELWYEGELGFFDFYILPLAKKLKDCGVFGVSSDEYLKYAENNRKEWEMRGRQVVEDLVESVKEEPVASDPSP